MTTCLTFARISATLLLSALAAGCGDDSEPAESGECPTGSAPTVLELRDVTPAEGETVVNEDIIQAFTVVSPPGVFESMSFNVSAKHTAGNPDTPALQISVTQEGQDTRYQINPITWSNAPAHVQLSIGETYLDQDRCAYVFPAPVFSYDITAAGEGGGGAGGAGGAGDGGAGGSGGN